MVNGAGAVNCRRIIHHLPVDLHRPAQRLLFLYRDGKGELGGEVPASTRLSRLPTGFASAHFHLAAGLLARITRSSVWYAPLVLLLLLDARTGADLRGLSSLGW